MASKKKIIKHLKGDIKTFKKEAAEDVKLIKSMGKKKKRGKMQKVLHEFKEGTLHSGSKKGPKVTSRKQAIAIGLSEAREAVKKKRKRRG